MLAEIMGRIWADRLQGRWPLAAFALAVCSLRVEFGRTDCRLGASDRLSAHPKENTGRIGTDRFQGRWPHLRSPSADYGSNLRGRIPGAQTLYARSSWS
jgi:hypothetical protein